MCETVTGIHLVMEMAPNGELFAKLSEDGPYREAQAKGIFAQIASAVQYMVNIFGIYNKSSKTSSVLSCLKGCLNAHIVKH